MKITAWHALLLLLWNMTIGSEHSTKESTFYSHFMLMWCHPPTPNITQKIMAGTQLRRTRIWYGDVMVPYCTVPSYLIRG